MTIQEMQRTDKAVLLNEEAKLRPMTEKERITYLRGMLRGAEQRLILKHRIPTYGLDGWDRLTAIEARNSDVAIVLTLYKLLPDISHRITADDLMIEEYPPDLLRALKELESRGEASFDGPQ